MLDDEERAWRLAYADAVERWLKAEKEIAEMKREKPMLYDFECKVLLVIFALLALLGVGLTIHAVLL